MCVGRNVSSYTCIRANSKLGNIPHIKRFYNAHDWRLRTWSKSLHNVTFRIRNCDQFRHYSRNSSTGQPAPSFMVMTNWQHNYTGLQSQPNIKLLSVWKPVNNVVHTCVVCSDGRHDDVIVVQLHPQTIMVHKHRLTATIQGLIYMQSNKIHNVVLMSEFYSALMLARHVSDLIGPSSGAFYRLYLQIWYVVIRALLDTSSRYFVTACTKRSWWWTDAVRNMSS